MHNWLKLNQGQFGYLYVRYRNVKVPTKAMNERFEKIYDQYIKEIGLTDDYKDMMNCLKRLTNARINNVLQPNSLNATREAAAQAAWEDFQSDTADTRFSEFVAMVSKHMGYKVDLKTTTVDEFYAIVKLIQRASEGHKGVAV